jgi:type I restriction enzyme R subunit
MLATYVQADEVIQVVAPVNIFEREAFKAEVDKVISPRAKADVIANRTKKTITEKMDEDPFFYRKFSILLQQAIEDYKAQRISEAALLAKVTDIMEKVRDGRHEDIPAAVRGSDLAKAFFGELTSQLGGVVPPKSAADASAANEDPAPYAGTEPRAGSPPPMAKLLGEVACDIERIIRQHAIVRWRENADAQNAMRNDLDDLLFSLQRTKGVTLTFEQMDAILEAILRIARNRSDV